MYITAISAMAAFWLFLLYNNHKRQVLAGFGIFNVIVYIIFVVLAILFEALPQVIESSVCESREPEVVDNTNTKIVSIVYQSIMAGISVFLALFIFGSGARLYFGLKKRDFEKKVALVTILCTFGLLLHCSFILYISATFSDNFTIIVLLIVLSEIVPMSLIMLQFSLLRASCFGKVKIPSYNRAKLLNTLRGRGTTTGTSTQTSTQTQASSLASGTSTSESRS